MRAVLLRVLDASTYLWCAIAAVLLIWQSSALARGITFGPGEPVLVAPLTDVIYTWLLILCTVPILAWVTWRLRGIPRSVDRALVVQVSVGLFALALSYRLPALLLLTAALISRLMGRRWRIATWCLWGLALIASIAPVDVTLRSAASHGPQLVATTNCEAATGDMVRAVYSGELVCVANGPLLYHPPRRAVVW